MRTLDLRFVTAGTLVLLTIVSGYWLSRSGRPLNDVIFAIHKLIALGAVIALAVAVNHFRAAINFGALEWSVIAATGAFFLALFVTGALLSIFKTPAGAVLAIHRVVPYLAACSAAATAYLVLGGNAL